ncbi:MAG: DUF192 domain-containing protein [Candidatus Omnitrophica bacterium]|nr:DUF192 domain-containing protein [Candidatus Omnitrophota bacterium]
MAVITNVTRGVVLADRAEVAGGLLKRMTGLLIRQRLPEGEALIFPRCHSIHTCFMRFPIDVVFVKTASPARRERSPGRAGFKLQAASDKLQAAGSRLQAETQDPGSSSDWASSGVVVKIVQHLKPFQIVWERRADTVIELPVGTIARTATQRGERLIINFASRNL